MANSIEQGLRDYLVAHASVSPLFRSRIYPQMGPQNPTYPYATFHRTGTRREHSLGKGDEAPTALVELTLWGGRGDGGYDVAKQLVYAVVPALEGYRGSVGTAPNGTWVVDDLFVDDEFDVSESPDFATANDPRGVTLQLAIGHKETLTNTAP